MKTVKRSRQRDAILSLLRSVDTHPTADWLYTQLKQTMPELSLGTVYRNLAFLVDAGEIMELTYGSNVHRYDGNAKNHYHFVCERCKNVKDIPISVKHGLEAEVSVVTGFETTGHRLEFFGVCDDCKKAAQADRQVTGTITKE